MISQMFPSGKLSQPYATTTLVNNTAKSITTVIPTGSVWWWLYGQIQNNDNVARKIDAYVTNASDEVLVTISSDDSVAAGDGLNVPCNQSGERNLLMGPILLYSTNKLIYKWYAGGASAGGTTRYSMCYLEAKID